MKQAAINNGLEFVIDTQTPVSNDSIYFKDEGEYISVAIENNGGGKEEATYIIYKNNAKELHQWLSNHL